MGRQNGRQLAESMQLPHSSIAIPLGLLGLLVTTAAYVCCKKGTKKPAKAAAPKI